MTPAQTSLPLGTTQQFTATGAYTDGSTSDLTTAVIWSSTTSSATVSNLAGSKGFLTTLAVGPATIAAASGNTVGTADLSVTSAALVSIAITPANFSAAQGLQQQLSATGSFSDGRQQDLTSDVTWNSSSPAVASVGNSPGTQGLVTTTSPGVTSVQAALGSIAGSTPFTVLPPLLTSMQISPLDPSIALGTTLQFVCTGAYSDGSTRDLTSSVSWNSSSPGVALAGSPPGIAGLATAQSVGVTTISVSSGALSAGTTLTVTPASLTSIAISPTAVTIPLGTPQQYAALGTFSDGSLQDVTGIVHWSTGDGTIGTISNSAPTVGLLTPVATGSVVVSAATGGVSGSAQLTVSPAALVSIIVTPQDLSLSLGATRQLAATGQYSDGSSQDLTSMASWSAGDETVAIVENAAPTPGLATAVGQGTVAVTASYQGVSGSATLNVTPAALVFVTLTPANATILPGATAQFSLLGTYSDNSTQDLTTTAGWSSSSYGTAVVSQGLTTGIAPGTAIITAVAESLSATGQVTVTSPVLTLVALQVNAGSSTMAVESSQQFSALGSFSDGSTQDMTDLVSWSSSDPAILSIESADQPVPGLGSAVSIGSVGVTAALNGVIATYNLQVNSNAIKIPLMDMTAGQNYLGFSGGLYENSNNQPPADHDTDGLTVAARIVPLDQNGNPRASGAVVFLAIGMSNALNEFTTFRNQVATNPSVNHTTLAIENGAFGSDTACFWTVATGDTTTMCPSGTGALTGNQYDRVRDTILAPAKSAPSAPSGCGGPPNPVPCLTEQQVQVLWIKNANPQPGLKFKSLCDASRQGCSNDSNTEAIRYEAQMGQIIRAARSRYPHLQEIFVSSRIYAGYATNILNPEPYAFEYGFSLKWLIQAQIVQERSGVVDPVAGNLSYDEGTAAWITWGPYLWADGSNPRSDGLVWLRTDFQTTDYTHPNATGQQKVSDQMTSFLLSSPYAAWFRP